MRLTALDDIWAITTPGSRRITVAFLDGPVDLAHPCFEGASLHQIVPGSEHIPEPSTHGTQVAGLVLAQPSDAMTGIAPACSGISLPIWHGARGSSANCTQQDLARAMNAAVELGADIINISGGELMEPAAPELEQAVALCADRSVMVVAAAGNDGCNCTHVPASIPSVLAVGAMDAGGAPLAFSNWGGAYRASGLLAPGTDLKAPQPGGGYAMVTGTSYAAAIVSGAAALLLSFQASLGLDPDPLTVRQALLETATPCNEQQENSCERVLAGRLNLIAAVRRIESLGARRSARPLSSQPAPQENIMATTTVPEQRSGTGPAPVTEPLNVATPVTGSGVMAAGIEASDCGCGCGGAGAARQLVYAVGTLGFDFGSRARQESLAADIAASGAGNDLSANSLLTFIENNPHAATDIIWTLNLDGIPVYAIAPSGPFASSGYGTLLDLLKKQQSGAVQRVAIPGTVISRAHLLNGIDIPLIAPALRGIFGFHADSLINGALQNVGDKQKEARRSQFANFFDRFYYELRNLGTSASERAINFAATTVFRMGEAFTSKVSGNLSLHRIEVSKSAISPVGGDCWDVTLSFFDPQHMLDHAREVFRFTVDVSQEIPVRIGPINSWATHSINL